MLAVALAVSSQAQWWQRLWHTARDPQLSGLVAAVGERRLGEGRVTGGFRYGAWNTATRSTSEPPIDNPLLLSEAGKLQKAAQLEPSAENLHAWGIGQLSLRQYDEGIGDLEFALLEDPQNARYAADLGAARLARSDAADRPDDLPRALEAVQTALTLDPTLPEAWFTKGILLERLGMRQQASEAWTRYLALDHRSAWQVEAQQRTDRLRVESDRGRWPELERDLRLPSPSSAQVDEAVTGFPEDVRDLLAAELLPAFAASLPAASSSPSATERLVRALDTQSPDRQFSAAVAQLVAAVDDSRRLAALVESVRTLGNGMRAMTAERYDAAETELGDAVRLLDAQGCALRDWALVALARVLYVKQRNTDALVLLDRALRRTNPASAPALHARGHLVSGVITFTLGRWSDASEHYARALEFSQGAGERQTSANAHVNAAILYRFLGNRALTWKHRLAAQRDLPPHRPLPRHIYLMSGAATASTEALPETALLFQTEAIANARAHLGPGPRVEAVATRARMVARLGRPAEAERDLLEAAALLTTVDVPGMRARLHRAWLLASAEVRSESAPEQAAADAARAVELVTVSKETMRSAELRLFESRALARLGRLAAAERSALLGIADFEQALTSIDARQPERLSAFEPVWDLYSQAARTSLAADAGQFDRAFALAERRRARTATEARSLKPRTLQEVRSRLREDEAIFLMDQTAGELVVWYIRPDGVRTNRVSVRQDELQRLTERHRRAINLGRRRDEASAALFDIVFRPWGPELGKLTSVSVIPDGGWQHVAWPVLWDRQSGKELVTTLRVVVSPSASHAVERRWAPADAAGVSALVVSAATANGSAQSLPGAQLEAREVSRMYPRARLLEGAAATPEAVKQALTGADLIHVSSHAIEVPAYPLMSHLLLFGVPGKAELFARDIASLVLNRPRLAVLAACATAGRTSVRGEGSVGVAWGFLTAGVPRVVATLQEIEDEPARQLFTSFHREILAGRSPAEALSRIQRALAAAGAPPRVWASVVSLGAL